VASSRGTTANISAQGGYLGPACLRGGRGGPLSSEVAAAVTDLGGDRVAERRGGLSLVRFRSWTRAGVFRRGFSGRRRCRRVDLSCSTGQARTTRPGFPILGLSCSPCRTSYRGRRNSSGLALTTPARASSRASSLSGPRSSNHDPNSAATWRHRREDPITDRRNFGLHQITFVRL
jgi:hypothetical protein